MTASKASGPGTSSTRMMEPATTPGMVPANSTAVSRPPVWPCRQYRNKAPGVATTLYRRFVGVTDGLGVPRTETWNGSKSTAPETPAGLATADITSAAASRREQLAYVAVTRRGLAA